MDANNCENYRNAIINEPKMYGPSNSSLQTPLGRIPTSQVPQPPPLPPRLTYQLRSYQPFLHNQMNPYGASAGGLFGSGMYGHGYGGYPMSGYNNYVLGGIHNGYGSVGLYGMNMNDPEQRFIQIAEESSRPAFQSIESLVMAISNIASMLDSTFFAITNSFRSLLGVAANFGRLRGVFAQFWSTFTIFRTITWLYRKCIYMLGITKNDSSKVAFNEVFNAVANGSSTDKTKGSAWPVIAFLGFIVATPYLISKLVGHVMYTSVEESKNPSTWVNTLPMSVQFNFEATSPDEMSIRTEQIVHLAPREIQQTQKLLDSGWALATIDFTRSGLIPVNYLKHASNIDQRPTNSANLSNKLINVDNCSQVYGQTDESPVSALS